MSLSQQTLIDRLHYLELFELFPAQVRSSFFNKAVAHSYKAGHYVYHRGDDGSYLGAIMSGRVRMSVQSAEGKGVLFTMVEQGEIFGETALMDGLPRSMDAIAETDCTVLVIKREDFLPVLLANPQAMYSIIKMLCYRLRLEKEAFELIALQNLPIRLARFLLGLAQNYGVEENGQIIIRAGLNQVDIAQHLAASRESINRQLKTFAAKGYVVLRGDEIVLPDITLLERLTDTIR